MMLVEKDLRQLGTFFFVDLLAEAPPDSGADSDAARSKFRQQQARYKALGKAISECKGSMNAIHDARYYTKVSEALGFVALLSVYTYVCN